ncbi:phage tail sheath monomer [Buttiauxella ferragutiae ATCC 51602]|uniref:Phage tail sheath monomer n=1 Tax=Buttiauxella ferragutiae ATCC 51602 TaxID=1354252 RepID=A0ABX2W7U8_9ENTR|nr:phage tail sheath subtilisin-like domain-containing protein [Buttiauxella ferragutiae]OAT26731.1 phage tail sheath monomer [Buttiauxella ferragutiae ATCC 51602]
MGLHGIDMQTTGGNIYPIATVQTAAIGIVGTAPDSAGTVAASLVTGTSILDNVITYSATELFPGMQGNALSVVAVLGDDSVTTVAATFANQELTITLVATSGASTSTAAEVVEVVNAIATPGILATLSGTGDGIIAPFQKQQLAGGKDEPYPLNTPLVIYGSQAQADLLGTTGTLHTAISEIFEQTGALIVGVRVTEGSTDALTLANIIAGIDILLSAQAAVSVTPKILITPEFSEDDGVGKKLESVATQLRAVTYLDSLSMATPADVIQRHTLYGERVEILRPRVKVTNEKGEKIYRPASAYAAGLRSRIDDVLGWWWSKSNQAMYGFEGLEQIDSWSIGDENTVANQLNMNGVSTIITYGGFRHWGNRNCSIDPLRWFEVAVRTDDILRDSIQSGLFPYLDRPLDIMLANDAVASVSAYLKEQTDLGAIHGGKAWLDEEINTAETIVAGHLYIDYDYGFKSPTERITCRVRLNTNYAKGGAQ